MGIFTRARVDDRADAEIVESTEPNRYVVPQRFEAVAEALAAQAPSEAWSPRLVAAVSQVGRALASDGASLEEALESLRVTHDLVNGGQPAFAVTTALSVAWTECTLAYLHQMSCEDPMTGLATLAHVRSRLSEHYRGTPTGELPDKLALVVIDLPHDRHNRVLESTEEATRRTDTFARALRMARLGEVARGVFGTWETVGRVGLNRIVVLVDRNDRLGQRVGLLRRMVANTDIDGLEVRVWIEGLPHTDAGAALLLDELARS